MSAELAHLTRLEARNPKAVGQVASLIRKLEFGLLHAGSLDRTDPGRHTVHWSDGRLEVTHPQPLDPANPALSVARFVVARSARDIRFGFGYTAFVPLRDDSPHWNDPAWLRSRSEHRKPREPSVAWDYVHLIDDRGLPSYPDSPPLPSVFGPDNELEQLPTEQVAERIGRLVGLFGPFNEIQLPEPSE